LILYYIQLKLIIADITGQVDVGELAQLHLVDDWQVQVDARVVPDERPSVFHTEIAPLSIDVDAADLLAPQHLLLVRQDVLQEAEAAASQLREPEFR